MSINKFITICLCCFLFPLIFNRCGSGKKINTLGPDEYQPIYKDNGGRKRTTIFNKNKVQQEKEFVALLSTVHELRLKNKPSTISKGNLSEVDKQIEKTIEETELKVRELEKKIRAINVESADSHEQILKYMKEVNDLLCGRIGAINKFLNKRISKIYADVSFEIGSSKISPKGLSQLEKDVVSKLIKDAEEWRNYVNDCNQKIFENDLFVLVVNIDGYADQQGTTENNQKLSAERALTVKREISRQLTETVTVGKINIVFDKIFANGHGEELPPGLTQKGENDPNRRVCLISSIVGPSTLLKN